MEPERRARLITTLVWLGVLVACLLGIAFGATLFAYAVEQADIALGARDWPAFFTNVFFIAAGLTVFGACLVFLVATLFAGPWSW